MTVSNTAPSSAQPFRVAVYCGSKVGARPEYAAAAKAFGIALAQRGWGLVYGGAASGVMGTLASAVLDHGGQVIGVIPRGLSRQEFAHQRVSDIRVVETMHQRKAEMVRLSSCFAALPGGYGTMDELFEIMTWAQIGLHQRPIGLLNVEGYFNHLLAWVTHAGAEGFVPEEMRDLLVVDSDPTLLVDRLAIHQPPPSSITWRGPPI